MAFVKTIRTVQYPRDENEDEQSASYKSNGTRIRTRHFELANALI